MKDYCWFDALKELFKETGDDFSKMICTISKKKLKIKFNNGFGVRVEGEPFTAWGENFVYFPLCYDGSARVGFAPRNPCDQSMSHQGGG